LGNKGFEDWMKGSLDQLGEDRWRLRVYAGRNAAGKVRQVSRNFAGTKRKAQSALAKLVTEVESGKVAKSHQGSVGDLLDAWVADIEPTRSAFTMREHRRSIEKDIKPEIGNVRLDRLTGKDLDRLYASWLARGLSPGSVRRHHSIISAALGRAVKWGLIPVSPANKATPPGLTRSTVMAPAADLVQHLIAEAEKTDPVLAAAIAIGAVTGARRGELCALRWSDMDWTRRTLTIARSLTVIDRVATEGPTKTHQRRDIAVDDALGAFLIQRRANQERYGEKVDVALVAYPYVLSRSADGGLPCLPDGLTGGYRRLAQKFGAKGHFHELRYFAATTASSSGFDVGTVAGHLGHGDGSVTLHVYTHVLEARDKELAALLGSTVLGPVNGCFESDQAHYPAARQLESAGQFVTPGKVVCKVIRNSQ
jgi:integrase